MSVCQVCCAHPPIPTRIYCTQKRWNKDTMTVFRTTHFSEEVEYNYWRVHNLLGLFQLKQLSRLCLSLSISLSTTAKFITLEIFSTAGAVYVQYRWYLCLKFIWVGASVCMWLPKGSTCSFCMHLFFCCFFSQSMVSFFSRIFDVDLSL